MIISGILSPTLHQRWNIFSRTFSVLVCYFNSADTSRAGDKFETISTNSGYSKFMKLKIRNVGPNDFGFYRCVAKNSLGKKSLLQQLNDAMKLDPKYWFLNFNFCLPATLLHHRLASRFPPRTGETDGMIKLDGEFKTASYGWRRENKWDGTNEETFLTEIAAPTTTLTTELTLFNKSKRTNMQNANFRGTSNFFITLSLSFCSCLPHSPM